MKPGAAAVQVKLKRASCQQGTSSLYQFICVQLLLVLSVICLTSQQAASAADDTLIPSGARELTSFAEFKSMVREEKGAPLLVMACGFAETRKSTIDCSRLLQMMNNLIIENPDIEVRPIYLNMSRVDYDFLTHMRYKSDPQFLYVKQNRIYYYAKSSVNNSHLVDFMRYFDRNPDFMYRSLSDSPLSTVDNMLEGLYRILDKTQVIFGEYRAALYFVYFIFLCVGCMMLYAIFAIIDEAITGRRYAHLAEQLKQKEALGGHAKQTSEDLKVKKD